MGLTDISSKTDCPQFLLWTLRKSRKVRSHRGALKIEFQKIESITAKQKGFPHHLEVKDEEIGCMLNLLNTSPSHLGMPKELPRN